LAGTIASEPVRLPARACYHHREADIEINSKGCIPTTVPIRVIADEDKPFVAIEVPLEKPLPDYDLEDLDKPTAREVDGILVSQGFRDLVDDARGVLLEILSEHHKSIAEETSSLTDLDLTPEAPQPMEITQLTGAICTYDEGYRPGLWIVLRNCHTPPNQGLSPGLVERISHYAQDFVKRMDLA
jgi:hypothetical protein